MTKYLVYLLLSLVLTVFVQASLKILSVNHSGDILSAIKDYRFVPILSLYGIAMISWFVAASKVDFTVLIPFNVVTIILGGVVGYFWFGEALGARKIISYVIITIGIILLASEK